MPSKRPQTVRVRGSNSRTRSARELRNGARPKPSSATVRRRMRHTARRDTPAELAVRRLVHRAGLRYRIDRAPFAGIRRRADLVFARARVAVFVDGCFWHCCPKHATWPKANAAWWRAKLLGNVARDRDTDRVLREAGWRVVRIWEHEEPGRAAARVRSVPLEQPDDLEKRSPRSHDANGRSGSSSLAPRRSHSRSLLHGRTPRPHVRATESLPARRPVRAGKDRPWEARRRRRRGTCPHRVASTSC
ncbi:MAG: DNA mismatch endonuclease Vsr [Planctomycetes bacterium]|nr:DNA mismatch endonuclease Vsr [Planctomycetota bacterium]